MNEGLCLNTRKVNALCLKYRKMVLKMAYHYSRSWRVPYDEMEGQGWEIFVETIKLFDENKEAEFGTYLYWRLRKLNDYGKKQGNKNIFIIQDIDVENISSRVQELFMRKLEFYDSIRSDLSEQAQLILDYILNADNYKEKTPSQIRDVFYSKGFSKTYIRKIWKELRDWWRNFYVENQYPLYESYEVATDKGSCYGF
jgi:hypothetical protein